MLEKISNRFASSSSSSLLLAVALVLIVVGMVVMFLVLTIAARMIVRETMVLARKGKIHAFSVTNIRGLGFMTEREEEDQNASVHGARIHGAES
jgi:hypothetical protein